jgi:TetR/AcrR family transcriptional regulator
VSEEQPHVTPEPGARERLLAAALDQLNRFGYAATSVREIVAAAGVTKPVLYYYFGSKEGLYLAILEEALATMRALVAEASQSPGSVRERIARLSEELFEAGAGHNQVVRLIYATYYGPPQGAPAFDFDVFHHAFSDVLEALVVEGMENGELRPGNPRVVTMALHGAATGALEASLAHPELGLNRKFIRDVLNVMLDGVATPEPQKES